MSPAQIEAFLAAFAPTPGDDIEICMNSQTYSTALLAMAERWERDIPGAAGPEGAALLRRFAREMAAVEAPLFL